MRKVDSTLARSDGIPPLKRSGMRARTKTAESNRLAPILGDVGEQAYDAAFRISHLQQQASPSKTGSHGAKKEFIDFGEMAGHRALGRFLWDSLPPGVDAVGSWLGCEVDLECRSAPDAAPTRIRGYVVDDSYGYDERASRYGAKPDQGQTFAIAAIDGKVHRVHCRDLYAFSLRRSAQPLVPIARTDDQRKQLGRDERDVVLRARRPTWDPRVREDAVTFLAGALRRKVLPGDYQVLSLTDANGTEHLIDPYFLDDRGGSFLSCEDGTLSSDLIDAVPLQEQPLRLIIDGYEGKKQLVDELIRSKEFFIGPRFFTWLEADLPAAKALIERWYRFALGNDWIVGSLQEVERLGERYVVALADPGVGCRLWKFIEFAKGYLPEHPGISAWELRQAFGQHLDRDGPMRVFRGIGLDDPRVAEHFHQEGARSYFLEFGDPAEIADVMIRQLDPKPPNIFDMRTRPLSPIHDVKNRRAGNVLASSALASTSGYPEVAASVGYQATDSRFLSERRRLFLLEMLIPRVDLVSPTELFAENKADLVGKSPLRDVRNRLVIEIGERHFDWEDPALEFIVPYWIRPEWVESHYTYEEPPPPYLVKELPGPR